MAISATFANDILFAAVFANGRCSLTASECPHCE